MKKLLSLLIVAAMLACFASVTSAAAPAGQIAWYDMDGTDEGLTVIGDAITFADGYAAFGGGSYIVADVDLSEATAFTVAYRMKADGVTGAQWPFEVTSETGHAGSTEHYIGCLINTGFFVERYNNSTGRPAGAAGSYPANEWFDMVCVFPEDGSIIIYINGEEAVNVPETEGFDLNIQDCIGETPVFQIGKANWNEYFKGEIDTFAIYTTALSADEVANALEAPEEAPQTGFATVALAIVAITSGAYIVTKKH